MQENQKIAKEYLKPTWYLDYHEEVAQAFVRQGIINGLTREENMIRLYYKVRDGILYNTHGIDLKPSSFKATHVIEMGKGFCIQKSVLLAAVARAIGVPSRMGFVDVKNHLASQKTLDRLRTDLFVFHSYTDLFMYGKWVKATPAFNKELCEKFNVAPLEFDGTADSLFQEYDRTGGKYMEYVKDHGVFSDLPYKKMIECFLEAYPHLYHEIT